MSKTDWINWSSVAREAFVKRMKQLELLERLESKEEKEETYPFFPDGFYEDVPNEKLDINGTLLLLKNTEGVELQNE